MRLKWIRLSELAAFGAAGWGGAAVVATGGAVAVCGASGRDERPPEFGGAQYGIDR